MKMLKSIVFICCLLSGSRAQDCSGAGFRSQDAGELTTASYKENRRSRENDVTAVEVTWQPQNMLTDVACFDMDRTELLYKTSGSADWQSADARMRSAGQASKWTLKGVKPCLQYEFAIKVTGFEGQEATQTLQQVVGPASEEEIINSGFVPDAPTGFKSEVGANSATLSWDESDCAASYEVTNVEVITQNTSFASSDTNEVKLDGLKFCTNYEVALNAVLNGEFSDETVANFKTKPRSDAAAHLEVEVKESMDSAVVEWEAWKVASCIDEYELTAEPVSGEAKQTEVVRKTPGLPVVSHVVTGLDSCTDYNLKIQPLYPGEDSLESKMVAFRTLSPGVESIEVGEVRTESVSSGSMLVSWPSVQCATSFKVFQKKADEYEWTEVARDVKESEITVDNLSPCTNYNFAVAAVLDGDAETEKSVSQEVTSPLDENEDFEAPNLVIHNEDRSATVEWDHASCIESYVVKVWSPVYTDPHEHPVTPYGNRITQTINDLEPCTEYSIQVVPLMSGKNFSAPKKQFKTTNGTPETPAGFTATISGSKAQLDWESVQCATGFKIYKVGTNSLEEEVKIVELNEHFEDDEMTPCQTYTYQVATIVGEQESARTELVNLRVPPRPNEAAVMKVLSKDKDSIMVSLDAPSINENCVPEKYHLEYSASGQEPYETQDFDPADVEGNGYIQLQFSGADTEKALVKGRIKFMESEDWTKEGRSREARDTPQADGLSDTGTIVPIAVGVGVAILIVAVIVVAIVMMRKNKRGAGYDAEKADKNGANGKSDETQKLNDPQA